MGTSGSSKGPGGGVPMVPPWVPDQAPQNTQPDGEAPANGNDENGEKSGSPAQDASPQLGRPFPSPIAPAGRFGSARLNFGNFARSGNRGDMQRGLRDYVRKGYGGSGTAGKRFGGTASTAEALHRTLSRTTGGGSSFAGSPLEPALFAGRSAREVIDAIIEAVRPADGTQDAEASRSAIKDSLSELLTSFPDADLFNLTEDQRDLAVERFVAADVYRRTALDIGKTIQDKASTAAAALSRLKEVRDYIKETVSAAFRKLRSAGQRLTRGTVSQVVRGAIRETLQVFEGYIL